MAIAWVARGGAAATRERRSKHGRSRAIDREQDPPFFYMGVVSAQGCDDEGAVVGCVKAAGLSSALSRDSGEFTLDFFCMSGDLT